MSGPTQVIVDRPDHSEQHLRGAIYDAITAAGYSVVGMSEGVYGVLSSQEPDLMITVTMHRTPVVRR